jgi:hypothetical protein
MNKKTIGIILSLLIIAGGVYLIIGQVKKSQKPAALDQFAQCLTEAGATYYGAFWCPNCQRQGQMFGKSKKYVNYIECSTPSKQQKEVCTEAGITGYPTWRFPDGTELSGTQALQTLAEKTSCELPQ